MKPSRRLALRRETLTELTTDDLSGLRGAAIPTLAAGCSLDEATQPVRDLLLKLTLNVRCSWSCI